MVFRQLVHMNLGQGSRGAMLPQRAASALLEARNCAILVSPLCGAQAPPTWMRSSSCCVLEVPRYASTSLLSTASRAASSFCCSSQCFFSDLYLISRSAGGAEVQARGRRSGAPGVGRMTAARRRSQCAMFSVLTARSRAHGTAPQRPSVPSEPAQALGGLNVLLNIVSFSSSTSARSRAFSCTRGSAAKQNI